MWKIHISANLNNHQKIKEIFIYFLESYRKKVNYKIFDKNYKKILDINANNKIGNKFITIYPSNVREFLEIFIVLLDLYKNIKAPKIDSDIQVFNTPIHYRFGDFYGFFLVNKYGILRRAVYFNNKYILDPIEYNKYKPDFIEDPVVSLFNFFHNSFIESEKEFKNELNINEYKISKTLKAANKGNVFLAVKNDKKYIVKQYKKYLFYDLKNELRVLMENEINITNFLSNLKNPYFGTTKIIEFFQDERYYYIVRDFYKYNFENNMDLFLKKYSLNLLRAIYILHRLGIFLCDLKLNNLFYYKDKIIFSDFENSVNINDKSINLNSLGNLYTPGFSDFFINKNIRYKFVDYWAYKKNLFFSFSKFIDYNSFSYNKNGFSKNEFETFRMLLLNKVKFINYINLYNKLKNLEFPLDFIQKNYNQFLNILNFYDINEINIEDKLIKGIYNIIINKLDFRKKYLFDFYDYSLKENFDPISIMYGISGVFLSILTFYNYLKKPKKDNDKKLIKEVEYILELLKERVLENYEDEKIKNRTYGLFFGKTGALFSVFVYLKYLEKKQSKNFNKELDFLFSNLLKINIRNFNEIYDITHGLAGYGLFLLDLYNFLKEGDTQNEIFKYIEFKLEEIFSLLVNKIQESKGFFGIRGFRNNFYLGFAHGSAGIIYFFIKFLNTFIDYKINQKHYSKIYNLIKSLFDNLKFNENTKEYFYYDIYGKKKRMGCFWCNGLAGISLIIPLIIQQKNFIHFDNINNIFKNHLNTIFKNLLFNNMGFCHGSTGNFLIFKTIYNKYLNNQEFFYLNLFKSFFYYLYYNVIFNFKNNLDLSFSNGLSGVLFSLSVSDFYDLF